MFDGVLIFGGLEITMQHYRVFQVAPVLRLAIGVFLMCLFSFQSANSQSRYEPVSQMKTPVRAKLLADVQRIEPGRPFRLSVSFELEPGWHIYYKDAGDAGMPTQLQWRLPKGFTASTLEWQSPETFNDSGIVTRGYRDRTTISAKITPPKDLNPGSSVDLSATVKWLSCKNECLPGSTTVSISLPVSSSSASLLSTVSARLSESGSESGEKRSLLLYLLFAFTGGMILNFMPCVLPVIAIKLMSLLEETQGGTQRTRLLGATFASGILASFLGLAIVVIAMKAVGQQVGWGFQFQYPGFLIGMSAIVTMMALSLFGVFYVSVPAGQAKLDNLAKREGVVGTFFKGVLATTLSTPCTAPFLGAALGFAFAQPWWTVLSIFLTIGIGMSLPYLVLTTKPEWMAYLPKPGEWMEKLKESMGFLLLGTVVWLLYVLGNEVGAAGVVLTVGFLLSLSLCAWIISGFTNLSSGMARRCSVWSLVLILGGLSYYMLIGNQLDRFSIAQASSISSQQGGLSNAGLNWEPFDLLALNRDLEQGKTVLLDFTADWCLTCKLNEKTVLASKSVMDKLRASHIVTMRADWTRQNPGITEMLNKFHRSGVPLYVIFPAHRGKKPIVLPEILTETVLLDKLDESVKAEI